MPCVEDALTHFNCKFIANALGPPPDHVVRMLEDSRALRQEKRAMSHKNSGSNFVVTKGGEGGGQTSEVGNIVLSECSRALLFWVTHMWYLADCVLPNSAVIRPGDSHLAERFNEFCSF
jgi:hypothetical protein